MTGHSPIDRDHMRVIYHQHFVNWRRRADIPTPWPHIGGNIAPAPKEPKEGREP